ncbi:HSP20 family protein [Prolixibacter denitrificans]|uniref:HSP20 family protein n=2 Tax=Prolixibacter denitrificans TaxID=1541063 RepID=A0A2P8C7V5_9BACT|nr:HSP20 family protein [Prolixibacter denitrificans]GET22167.1 heat-shock protein [Prolixibacter denitrificans]
MLNLMTYPNAHSKMKSNNDLLDRLFNDSVWNDSFASSRPKANVKEEKDQFVIELVAPGFTKEQININLEKEILTIKGESEKKEQEAARYTTREFVAGDFVRRFSMPDSVDTENITAGFSNGILEIRLPKREENIDRGPRTIKIG